jgi:hypothetical protein
VFNNNSQLYFLDQPLFSSPDLQRIDMFGDRTTVTLNVQTSISSLSTSGCSVFDKTTGTFILLNIGTVSTPQIIAMDGNGNIVSKVSVGTALISSFPTNITGCDIHPGLKQAYFATSYPSTAVYIIDYSDVTNLKLINTAQFNSLSAAALYIAVDVPRNYLYVGASYGNIFNGNFFQYNLISQNLKQLSFSGWTYTVSGLAVDQRDGQAYFLVSVLGVFYPTGSVAMPDATFSNITYANFPYQMAGRPAFDVVNARALVQITTPYKESIWSFPVTPFIAPIPSSGLKISFSSGLLVYFLFLVLKVFL